MEGVRRGQQGRKGVGWFEGVRSRRHGTATSGEGGECGRERGLSLFSVFGGRGCRCRFCPCEYLVRWDLRFSSGGATRRAVITDDGLLTVQWALSLSAQVAGRTVRSIQHMAEMGVHRSSFAT